MKVKGYHFALSQSGIQEKSHEGNISAKDDANRELLIFCDVLSLDDKGQTLSSQDCNALSTLIDRWMRDSLTKDKAPTITEEAVTAAFKYTNQRMLQSEDNAFNQVAVSVIVIAPTSCNDTPNNKPSHVSDLLIAGVGDSYVYKIKPDKAELVFHDPLNNELGIDITPEDRLYSLRNAIGIKENIKVHCRRIQQSAFQRYTIASYGFYAQTTEDEILELGLRPHDLQTGASRHLSEKEQRGHALMIHTVSYGSVKEAQSHHKSNQSKSFLSQGPRRRKQRLAAVALSITTCVLALGLSLLLGVSKRNLQDPNTQKRSPLHLLSSQNNDEKLSTEDQALVAKLREKITLQKQKIAAMNKELLSGKQQVEELTKIHDSNDMKDLCKQIALLQQQLADRDTELKHSSILRQDLEYQLDANASKIANLNKTIETLKSIIDVQDESQNKDLHLTAAQFDELRKATDTDREELLAAIRDLKERNQQLQYVIDQQANTLAKNNSEDCNACTPQHLEASYQQQVERYNEMNEKLAEAMETLEREQRRNETLTDRIREIFQENQQLEETYAETQNQIQDHTLRIEQLLNDNLSLQEQLTASNEVIEQKAQALMHLQDSVTALTQHNQSLENEMVVVKEQMANMSLLKEKYEQEKHQLSSKESLLTQLKATLHEQETLIASLEKSRKELLGELTLAKQTLEQQQAPKTKEDPITSTTRIHLVSSGETLSSIAFRYYGTSKRWQDIYQANHDIIADVDKVKVGTALIIP